jgi:hypothetical protein
MSQEFIHHALPLQTFDFQQMHKDGNRITENTCIVVEPDNIALQGPSNINLGGRKIGRSRVTKIFFISVQMFDIPNRTTTHNHPSLRLIAEKRLVKKLERDGSGRSTLRPGSGAGALRLIDVLATPGLFAVACELAL